jgi:hypothetical protein
LSSIKEASNMISEELIKIYKAANATYWWCDDSNHDTTESYAKTANSGKSLEKTTVGSQRKRRRSDEENEVENENNKTKNLEQ